METLLLCLCVNVQSMVSLTFRGWRGSNSQMYILNCYSDAASLSSTLHIRIRADQKKWWNNASFLQGTANVYTHVYAINWVTQIFLTWGKNKL